MAYKVLYRKYRPDNFDNVVGQEYTIEMLKNAIISGKNSHAYIFTGPRGTGKTSTAKIFAKAINCEHPVDGNPCGKCDACLSFKDNPDIIEIDAASNNGVDEIRELINNVKLVPTSLKYKVYIIDEVHMLTPSAFNALLLTLEEPPSHVIFILATTDIQDVPITILSRCQRFDFKPINKEVIVNRLKYVCNEENIKITDDALEEIALISAGGMRDALGMLDQLASDDKEITLEMVSSYFGSISTEKINELLTSINNNDVNTLLSILGNIKESGTNYAVFVEKLIEILRKNAIDIKTSRSKYRFDYDTIYHMILDLNDSLCNININIDPYLLIEMVLLKYVKTSENYFPGNNLEEKTLEIKEKKEEVKFSLTDVPVEETPKKRGRKPKVVDDTSKNKIAVDIRINNTFVNADKKYKSDLSDNWVDFMNYLMSKDRSLISLLADTSILAASDCYALIQSKIDSTNDLINDNINLIEKYFSEYSGNNYRFAAVNNELWKISVDKYRINMKNKIKYSYMEEEIPEANETENITKKEDIEDLAKDIFGSYDVE
mgnify:CR=1 FL=1